MSGCKKQQTGRRKRRSDQRMYGSSSITTHAKAILSSIASRHRGESGVARICRGGRGPPVLGRGVGGGDGGGSAAGGGGGPLPLLLQPLTLPGALFPS